LAFTAILKAAGLFAIFPLLFKFWSFSHNKEFFY